MSDRVAIVVAVVILALAVVGIMTIGEAVL